MTNVRSTTLTLAIFLFASAAPIWPQATQLAFSGTRQDYFTYSGGFAMADFNRDGYPDIVTNGGGNSVEILLNDGTGHFNLSTFIPGGSSNYFTTGDFNGDGLVDVAYTSYYGAVTIILGAGNGTLRTVFTTSGGAGGDLKAVDLNGDGILDLVVGGYQMTYFIGNGDGSMQPPVNFPNLQSPFAVADINGDGHPDVIAYQSGAGIGTAINTGAGVFNGGSSTALPPGVTGPIAIAAGDFDGNGTIDLAVSAQKPYEILTYKGSGTGSFAQFGTIPLSFNADDVALLDVNADGKLDLIYDKTTGSHYPSTNLAIDLGNGDGTFGSPTNYATAGANYRILLSDTRKSGTLDLLVGGNLNIGGNGDISVLPNKGNNVFTQGSYETLSGVLQNTVSSDFNHDGIRDLVVSVRLSTSSPSIQPDTNSQFAGAYVLLGTGNPTAPFTTGQRMFIPPDVLNLALGDFNKDGSPDLAFVTGQNIVIYLGNGDGTFTKKAMYPCTCTALAVADFNGDGKPDIATNGVFIYLGNGDGTFGAPLFPIIASGNYITAADFNGDGKADLIVATGNNSSTFYVALGNGDGTFTTTTNGQNYSLLTGVVADFNGDGVPDFAEWTNYYIYVYLNAGGVFTLASSIPANDSSRANTIAAADFNQDGKMDLAIPGFGFTVFTGNGDGTFGPGSQFDAANYPNVVIAADFYDFNQGKLPDLLGIGQNGAISFLFNESH